LIAGTAAVCGLTFLVAMSFLFTIFIEPPVWKQVIGYASLVGPLPLMTCATLLFFRRTEKPGAKLVLAGSARSQQGNGAARVNRPCQLASGSQRL
jgi:hypothetical protein